MAPRSPPPSAVHGRAANPRVGDLARRTVIGAGAIWLGTVILPGAGGISGIRPARADWLEDAGDFLGLGRGDADDTRTDIRAVLATGLERAVSRLRHPESWGPGGGYTVGLPPAMRPRQQLLSIDGYRELQDDFEAQLNRIAAAAIRDSQEAVAARFAGFAPQRPADLVAARPHGLTASFLDGHAPAIQRALAGAVRAHLPDPGLDRARQNLQAMLRMLPAPDSRGAPDLPQHIAAGAFQALAAELAAQEAALRRQPAGSEPATRLFGR